MGTLKTRVLGKPVEITVETRGSHTQISTEGYDAGFYWQDEDFRRTITTHHVGHMLGYKVSDRIAELTDTEDETTFYHIVCEAPLEDLTMARIAHMVAMDY